MNKTKYLHELIAHAKVGTRFQAKLGYLGDESEWLDGEYFLAGQWSIQEITQPWVFKEIKEPRIVEFEAQVLPGTSDLNASIKRSELIPFWGKFVKVTVTEVIE